MAIHRLLEDLEIDWHRLRGPALDRDAAAASRDPGQGRRLTLENFRTGHLRSPAALEALYRQAVARGLLADSEAGFITFLSTAAYCLRVGRRPAALFVHLVKKRAFPASLTDEDRALAGLKRRLAWERERRRWLRSQSAKAE